MHVVHALRDSGVLLLVNRSRDQSSPQFIVGKNHVRDWRGFVSLELGLVAYSSFVTLQIAEYYDLLLFVV